MNKFLFVILSLTLVPQVIAVPARPVPFNLTQPDGKVFSAMLIGDERSYRIETLDGYTIVKNVDHWVYAEGVSGSIVKTDIKVGSSPGGIQKHARPMTRPVGVMAEKGMPTTIASVVNGSRNILVVLINFTDNPRINSSKYQATYYEDLILNGSNNMSMVTYYNETSYEMLSINGTVTTKWYTSNFTESYWGNDSNYPGSTDDVHDCIYNLAREAIIKADPDVDFSVYDSNSDGILQVSELAIVIVHAGCGEEDGSCTGESTSWSQGSIWSHKWTIWGAGYTGSCPGLVVHSDLTLDGIQISRNLGDPSNIGSYIMLAENSPMGTFAHEFGHTLGLPDLYDTDSSSAGIGRWGLMASGSWLGPSTDGTFPAHMMAWSKYYLGWANPQQITNVTYDEEIQQAEFNDDVYMLGSNGADTPGNLDWSTSGGTGEYFLVENRQQVGFDLYLPGSGLLVYHVDETITNNNAENRKLVDVEEGHGGSQHLDSSANKGDASDPFYLGNKALFNDTTDPNSNYYGGVASNLSIYDVSSSGATMTADFLEFGVANQITLTGNLTPTSGNETTSFNYTANYTHGNNTAPVSINVTIDGTNYGMAGANATDSNYSDGKIYYYNTTLSLGGHNYSFSAYDGTFSRTTDTTQGPYASNLTGPFVDLSLSPTSDNEVKSGYPTTVFSSDNNIDVGNDILYDLVQRFYGIFNVSAIQVENGTIASAVLYLTRIGLNENSVAYGSYRVTASWGTGTLTWNNQPNVSSETTGTNVSEILSFNVTGLVQNWVDNSSSNYGVSIRKLNESVEGYGTFASSEHSTASLRPMLNITYQNNTHDTTPPTVNLTLPVNNSYQNSSNVTFSYTAFDFWGIANCSLYGNFSGSWAINQTNASVTNNTQSNFTVTLADGSYIWAVNCYDTKNNSGFSENFTVNVDATPPSAPTLLSPLGISTNETPTFTWDSSLDNFEVAFYTLQVSNFSSFSVISYTANSTSTNHTANTTLNDGLYFWRVRAVDNVSNSGNFSTGNLSVKTIKINEFLPRPNATMVEFIESYTTRASSYNLSGWILGNLLTNYTISYNITDFLVLNRSTTNISLNETNDSIMLWEPNSLLIDNISFYDGQTFGNETYNSSGFMSIGRSTDGGESFASFNQSSITMGSSNIGSITLEVSLLLGWNLISVPLNL